jgi:hypothetical protein
MPEDKKARKKGSSADCQHQQHQATRRVDKHIPGRPSKPWF